MPNACTLHKLRGACNTDAERYFADLLLTYAPRQNTLTRTHTTVEQVLYVP